MRSVALDALAVRGGFWSLRRRIYEAGGNAQVLVAVLVVVVGFLVLYPLVMLLLGSFAPSEGATTDGFSLDGYKTAFTDVSAQRAMVTTLVLSVIRAILATSLAVVFAWTITRTNVPGRRVFHNLMIVGFFLPTLPQIVAWSLLFSPRAGIVNVWLRGVAGVGAGSGPLDLYSYGGIVFLGVLGWSGFLYLMLVPAFQAMDASLEEAARTAGCDFRQTMVNVTIPLMLPAILGAFGLAFVRMVESFDTELFLGLPAGIYVFTTQIYYYIHSGSNEPNYPPGIALCTVLVAITCIVIFLQTRLLGKRSYVTVTGKNYRTAPSDLGRWKWPVMAFLGLFVLLHVVLPIIMLVIGSLQRSSTQFGLDRFTLDHWSIVASADVWQALQNTLVVGVVAATATVLLTSLISYVVVRTKFALRGILDGLTWVPYMVPSFVLAVGILWAVLKGIDFPFVLYGTLGVLMIAFVIRLMPLGARMMNGTMAQLSAELEESGRMSGASWLETWRLIVLPILRPSLVIGWLMFMMIVIRDLSTVILLYGPKSKVLSIVFYAYWNGGSVGDAAAIGLFMTVVGLVFVAALGLLQRATRSADYRGII